MVNNKLSEDEKQFLKIIDDPIAWAEFTLRNPEPGKSNLKIHLREYQKEILRDPSVRKACRMGRRLGKTTTMVVHILWYAYTHADSKQLISAPYDSQVQMIFDMMRAFIKNSPGLQGSIRTDKKNPSQIKLSNGALISGFTAGTKSGAQGGSMRGQAADWIYMDEMDYMDDASFQTIAAVAIERPEIGIWVSSTPTGRRGMFWKICTGLVTRDVYDGEGKVIGKQNVWSEHYHTSMENPSWGPEMEAEFRSMFPDEVYKHEVLAEFGEESIGVFNKLLIDRARSDYAYFQYFHQSKRGPRIMGVDWDKFANASQCVILEYDKSIKKFIVINRHETPKSEFTLTNAVNRIIELNEKFDLDYIYVDRGYGEHQVETLHKYGMENPESGMHKKVFGIQFSETKEIIDPFTKKIESQPIKPFMVNNLVNIFESGNILISDIDDMIIRQLENYQVIRKTTSGVPVYTSEDEHALDCIMLAAFGFVEKFPEIIDDIFIVKFATNVRKITADGEKTGSDKMKEIVDEIFPPSLNKPKGFIMPAKVDRRGMKSGRGSGMIKRKDW